MTFFEFTKKDVNVGKKAAAAAALHVWQRCLRTSLLSPSSDFPFPESHFVSLLVISTSSSSLSLPALSSSILLVCLSSLSPLLLLPPDPPALSFCPPHLYFDTCRGCRGTSISFPGVSLMRPISLLTALPWKDPSNFMNNCKDK